MTGGVSSENCLKLKSNGIFCARLVACGYSQVPSIDFNECFSPIINDVSFRILLIANLCGRWKQQLSTFKPLFFMET
jgi:hypothetical protein